MNYIVKSLLSFLLLTSLSLMGEEADNDIVARRHVHPAPSGELVGIDGKPVFLISTSVKWPCLQFFYKNRAKFKGTYPKGFEWLYDSQTSVSMLERCGFNALNFIGTEVAYRSLAPDYAGFDKKDAWSDFEEFIKKYKWNKLKKVTNRKAYEEYINMIKSASGIPVYVDFHTGYISMLTRNRKLVSNLINPNTNFSNPDQHSAFSIRYALCNPDGRELILKMYKHQTEEVLATGIRPFAYKLFNEPDYRDLSPKNYKAFKKAMQRKYKNVWTLNKAWRTNFRSFNDIIKNQGNAAKIEFKKFMEQQVVQLSVELRDMIRKLDPGASTFFQVHKNAYRRRWNNFDLYSLNKNMDIVSCGTGNYAFSPSEHADDSIPFKNSTSPSNMLREYFGSVCFYRALADNKPMVTTEAYFAGCGERYKQLKQVFWHEMIYGSNMVNMWEWIGYWKPKQKHNRISYGLHNQNVVSPHSWRALDDARKEIKTVSDFFQYRKNRPQAKIASLFSYPTLRINENMTDGYIKGIAGLTMRHIPVDAILEEQLRTGRQKKYKIILAMGVKNVYPSTTPILKKYVEEGGILVVGGNYLNYDEYDNPLKQSLIPLKTTAGTNKKQRIPGIDVNMIDSTCFARLPPGWKVVYALKGKPVVVSQKLGKGKIIALAGSWSDNGLTEILADTLKQNGIKPVAELRRADSDDLPGCIGAHRADHDGMTAWYFVNYNDAPKLIRVTAPEFRDAVVVNHFDKEDYPVDDDTITLLLPPQYHRVVISGPREKVEARFGHFNTVSLAELRKKYEDQVAKLTNKNTYARKSTPLDISKFANYGFDNQQGWVTGTAWNDSKGKDLKRVPFHGSVFKHINFNIIRFDFNHNKTCIALKSKNLPEAPEQVKNIPLNGKFRGLAFLQAVTHAKTGEVALKYKFNYEDGSCVEVPIRVGKEIGDWKISDNSLSMKKKCAWKCFGKGFFFYEWNNPQPSKILKSLSIISGNGQSVPIVVAISTLPTIFTKEYKGRIMLSKVMKANFKREGNGWHKDGTLHKNQEGARLETINGKPLPVSDSQLMNAVIRFQVKFGCDKWGKQMPVKGYLWPYVVGKFRGTPVRTVPRQSSIRSNQLNMLFKKFRASEWNEVEIPLNSLLKVRHSSGQQGSLNNIYVIAFQSKDSYLIFRDLRIEY